MELEKKKNYFESVKFDARFSCVAHDFFLLEGQKIDWFAPQIQRFSIQLCCEHLNWQAF